MSRTVSLAFRTRADLNEELEALAKATDRSKSWHIEQALEAYLAYEREVREKIKEGLADIEAGRTVPHEEVAAWIDSLGTDRELPMPQSRKPEAVKRRASRPR